MRQYRYKHITIDAISIGGVENCYLLKDYKFAVDIGRGPQQVIEIPNIFITHGHLDHAAGIPYYFSQRSLKGKEPGTVYVPKKLKKPLNAILKKWHKIEGFQYSNTIKGLKHLSTVPLTEGYYIKCFESFHRIPGLSYALMRKTSKLKKEFLNLPGEQIKKLRESKKDIFDAQHICVAFFSGDTTIEVLEKYPEARQAKVLVIECTYIDDARPIERARKWGHIHLDEIIDKHKLFENEKIFLTHFSRRYQPSYIKEILNQKLPDEIKNRIEPIIF
ncbi:MAG: MBL fold metallo-hydrolase [Spirochaetia bacterium]|nr:MBL fold metallo-hydrolase [Spirochaetia bacterium]